MVAEAGLQALDEGAIQIWLDDPAASEALSALHWDGAMQPQDGADFLALIDTNMGYNKADYLVERSVSYAVEWPDGEGDGEGDGGGDDEAAMATTTITYNHPAERKAERCDLTPRYGSTYEDMAIRCYFNYVRLYVPLGSEILETEGIEADTFEANRGENGTQVFAGYFVLKPGEQKQITFSYQLPPEIQADDYELLVQRQAGTNALPFSVLIGDNGEDFLIDSGRLVYP